MKEKKIFILVPAKNKIDLEEDFIHSGFQRR